MMNDPDVSVVTYNGKEKQLAIVRPFCVVMASSDDKPMIVGDLGIMDT